MFTLTLLVITMIVWAGAEEVRSRRIGRARPGHCLACGQPLPLCRCGES